jgi:ketosteroid isomerase-like protein
VESGHFTPTVKFRFAWKAVLRGPGAQCAFVSPDGTLGMLVERFEPPGDANRSSSRDGREAVRMKGDLQGAGYCGAMSRQNVQIALALPEAWNRGDREAFMALWDEEAVFYPFRAQLEGGSYRGHDGLERFMREMAEDFEDVRFKVDEARDVGEQVVGIGRFLARGRASGVDLDVPLGVLMTGAAGEGLICALLPGAGRCPQSRWTVGVVA